MDIYRTHNSIYITSNKYPALRVELILDPKTSEQDAEAQLLQLLAQAEQDYERSLRIQPDEEGKAVEVEIQRDKPTLSTIRRWIRQYRNQLLAESDYAMLPDVATDKRAWQDYRQALRDLPQTWRLDEETPSVDVSGVYEYVDVAKLPFPRKPG